MTQWDKMRSSVLHVGKLETPLLMSMVQRYDRQAPADDPNGFGLIASNVVFVVQFLILALFAFIYTKYRKVPEGEYKALQTAESENNWSHACWTCYEEPGTCLCALCCLPIRWAETISLVKGLLSFWLAFFLMAFLVIWQSMLPFVLWLVFIAVGVKYRQDLRKKFNFQSQGGLSYLTDCCLYCCCVACAVIQEARHVEDALAAKHEETECPDGRQRSSLRSECWTSRLFQEGAQYREYNW